MIESSTPPWPGFSARGAAERFGSGEATASLWVRRARQTGERKAHKQGQPRCSKLDPHRDYLLGLIAATPDLTISELLELAARCFGPFSSAWA